MRDLAIILAANVVLFVWMFARAFRKVQRERFMGLVRSWDAGQRKCGYAIAAVEVKTHWRRLYGEGRAIWRNAEGDEHVGKAKV